MAGGMHNRHGGIPLAERARAGAGGAGAGGAGAVGTGADGTGAGRAQSSGRHCWVLDPPGGPNGKWPGVIMSWRREAVGTWSGETAYVVDGPTGATLVVAWLDANYLAPASP